MPSRPVVILILVFWLATTGWFMQREVIPRLGTGKPPQFSFDLEDEFSHRFIEWHVFKDRKLIGTCKTTVEGKEGRLFELTGDYSFRPPLDVGLGYRLAHYTSTYTVTLDGELRNLSTRISLKGTHEVRVAITAWAKGDRLHPHLAVVLGKSKPAEVDLEPVPLPPKGWVLTFLHPQHRMTNLHEGQRWKVPFLNPLSTIQLNSFDKVEFSYLIADVHADTITWRKRDVDCWRIDFAEPGKAPMSQLWARADNGLVIQQRGDYQGLELLLIRNTGR
jgi:hypothetical protein